VQLSAGFSRAHVLAFYATIAKRFGEILGGRDPSIFSSVLRSRGTQPFYQVRVGAPTRPDADMLCGKIMRAGGACFVLRNGGRAG
jgi:SPOR domain